MSTTTMVRRPDLARVVLGGVVVATALLVLLTAPDRPGPDETWRWATIIVGLATCIWNVTCIAAAFRRTGPVSLVAFLHLWAFFAFSFPAVEMTYRYDQLSLGFWQTPTNAPVLLQAVALLAAFQVLFFLALGNGVDATVGRVVRSSRTWRPDQRIGLVFVVLLLPLVLARLLVLRELGPSGVATSMITRTDYFEQLDSGVSPIVWALNTLFPVYGVALGCLAVKFLVPHPTTLGRRLFLILLMACTAGVALSGGRAELVLVVITVGFFMYVAGYRTVRQFAPLVLPTLLVAGLLFAVGQARHGEDNVLSQAADGTIVGNDYSSGDITQVLGLGRFDAMVMILDHHDSTETLLGTSYLGALSAGLDTTFLPRIAAGVDLPSPTVSGDVLGTWVFGGPQVSVLPSAPGEAYLNFGFVGVLGAALVLALLARGLVGLVGRLPRPQEFAFVLVAWTIARLLSDESAILASFVVRNWPGMLVVALVAYHATRPVAVSVDRS